MPFGLIISLFAHVALIAWAVIGLHSQQRDLVEDTPIISADLITPSEFLRLKQGSDQAKNLETKAREEPAEDDSKNDTKKPDNTAAPAAAAPPPEPEPQPEPPKPEPPGPTPDEQKLLQQKIDAETKAAAEKAAAEAKQKAADAAAKAKAEAEAKQKAAEAEARKKAEAEKKKKAALAAQKKRDAAKRKAAEAKKKKLDVKKLADLLDTLPDDGKPKALIDKDPRKKGQQASGSSKTATAVGEEAGVANGTDTVLSAREQDLLKGMIRQQIQPCWRLPGGGGGTETPTVTLRWRLKPDGSLDGEPAVTNAPSGYQGQIASETALRAVKNCQPFRLPPDSYDGWKDVIWVFDPRQML